MNILLRWYHDYYQYLSIMFRKITKMMFLSSLMIIDSNNEVNEVNEHILINFLSIINGHAGTDLLEIPIPYRRPIFEGYVREYPYKI